MTRWWQEGTLLIPSILAGIVSFVLLLSTFDVGWWAIDDGVFAYMAEQVLHGAVYGVDVHDFHAGYHTYLNALLFKLFGTDMVVLRYPFIAIGAIEGVLVAYLLREKGFSIAFLTGVAMTVFSYVLFPHATPNWYALFFTILVIFIVSEWGWNPYALLTIGFIWGLCFMFRHPSALFLLLGIVAYGIHQQQKTSVAEKRVWSLHHLVLLGLGMVVLLYSSIVYEWFGFVLFGFPPLVLVVLLWQRAYMHFKTLFADAAWFGVGAIGAILPMIIFQLLHGNVLLWIQNSFLSGLNMAQMHFFDEYRYLDWFANSYMGEGKLALTIVLFCYYLNLLFAPLILATLTVYRQHVHPEKPLPPVVPIAIFYGLVSFYFQIEFYFFASFPIVLLAIFTLIETKNKILKVIVIACLLNLQVISLFWLAPFVDQAKFPEAYIRSELAGASVVAPSGIHARYRSAVDIIDTYSEPGDTIFVFPFNPEYYFLSKRVNPFTSLGSSFEVLSESDYKRFLNELSEAPPKMMIFPTDNFYSSSYDWELLVQLQNDPDYRLVADEYGTYFFARVDVSETQRVYREDNSVQE